MSNKRYRSRPGQPRTETEAMIRAMAMEELEGPLGELEMEISVLQKTLNLYHMELTERLKNPKGDHGRWQVAPGVAMRAQASLRKLRKERDALLGATEEDIVATAMANNATRDAEESQKTTEEGDTPDTTAQPEAYDWQSVAREVIESGTTNLAKEKAVEPVPV